MYDPREDVTARRVRNLMEQIGESDEYYLSLELKSYTYLTFLYRILTAFHLDSHAHPTSFFDMTPDFYLTC
jgi:hypothetical protein